MKMHPFFLIIILGLEEQWPKDLTRIRREGEV
jgi:hypothetical protein